MASQRSTIGAATGMRLGHGENTGTPTDLKRTRARLHLRAFFLTLTFIQ